MFLSLFTFLHLRSNKNSRTNPLELQEERRDDQIEAFIIKGKKKKRKGERRAKPVLPEMNSTVALVSPSSDAPPGKEQQAAGVGILLQISMLVLSFVLGHVLRRHKFYYLPEASASLLIG